MPKNKNIPTEMNRKLITIEKPNTQNYTKERLKEKEKNECRDFNDHYV